MAVSQFHHRDCRRHLADSQHHASPQPGFTHIGCCTSLWNGGLTDTSIPRFIYLPKRNPRLSIEEFRERWRQHSLLGATVPELRPKFT